MKRHTFGDEVRQAVRDSGRSQCALAKQLGINKGSMSRFMSGKSGLAMKTLDRLADLLDLHLAGRPAVGKRLTTSKGG